MINVSLLRIILSKILLYGSVTAIALNVTSGFGRKYILLVLVKVVMTVFGCKS